MSKYMAAGIHYDHRQIPPHDRYSTLVTHTEWQAYLDHFLTHGLGGEGFHKCINFRIRDDDPVDLYLTPTSLPGHMLLCRQQDRDSENVTLKARSINYLFR